MLIRFAPIVPAGFVGVLCCTPALGQQPVQVFILAGQSNMQGLGWYNDNTNNGVDENGTLRKLVESNPGAYGSLLDSNDDWVTRNDVFISTIDGNRSGGLTVGYGANPTFIGPELGFGTVIGDAYSQDVLIIKTAWGGKSLAVDFRPPSAVQKRGGSVGEFYTATLERVDEVLSDIGSYVPGYSGQGYELKGFGWHQGWNDRVTPAFVGEYAENMADFVNDIRFDLRASDLPFVIANTGIAPPLSGAGQTLANAQLSVDEFSGSNPITNVRAFDTTGFWRSASNSPVTSGNQGFHWNQNGETHYLMGEAMGQAMASLSAYVPFERAYLEIDQQSGQIRIINPGNNLEDMDLKEYRLTSASGALDTGNWVSISGNYDSVGDGSVDDGFWFATINSNSELREIALPGGADGLVTVGNVIDLGVGTWIGSPTRDIIASYTDTDGNVIDLGVRYVGFDNVLGDLTTDGSIDVNDWAMFVQGIQLKMDGLSQAQAYQLGDLDGDLDNDLDDFDLFRRAFEEANPAPGAFQAMLAEYAVPEPNSLVLLAGAAGLIIRRRRSGEGTQSAAQNNQHADSTHKRRRRSMPTALLACAAAALSLTAVSASAQEMFSVNLWSRGSDSPTSVWENPANLATLSLEPGESAGLFETTNWQNINFGNAFSKSTPNTTINGSLGSSATFSMPKRRNSGPYYWNGVRNDNDAVSVGNATLLDGHAVGTEDPFDESNIAVMQFSNIPFAVYDVVIYLGINQAQSFNGKGTIDFDGNLQEFTMFTGEPNGQLTRILDATTPGNYFLYEQVTGSSFTAEIIGENFTHLGPAGFQIVEVVDPTALELQVNTVTGRVMLMGDNEATLDVNYYQITSAGESLDVSGWNSLADQDFEGNGPANGSGNGWEEGVGVGAHALAEAYLLGDSPITPGSAINLGTIYDTAIDAQDLAFSYRSATGQRFEGFVTYVSTLPGDTDGDGDIDDADLGTSFANYTGPLTPGTGNKTAATGDTDGDGDVDDADLGTSFAGYTGPLGPSSVPEPTSLAVLTLLAGGLVVRRRRA